MVAMAQALAAAEENIYLGPIAMTLAKGRGKMIIQLLSVLTPPHINLLELEEVQTVCHLI